MIEPTDEQVAAFQRAWEAENAEHSGEYGYFGAPGNRTRAGLRAVLNMEHERGTS